MKSSHAEDSASQKFPGSTRSHIVSRLIKASKQAEGLVEILRRVSKDGGSEVDFLEAQAYATYLVGLAEFEKHSASPKLGDLKAQREKWQECLENLAVARVIYGALLKKTKKDYFKEMLSGSVDPSIRFAAYQSEIPRTIAISEVARRYFPANDSELVKAVEAQDSTALKEADQKGSKEGSLPTSISWRSRKANIVDASIGQALVAVYTAEARLIETLSSKSKSITISNQAAAYDDVLNASQDAVDATRHAIEDHEKEKVAESDPKMQDLRVTNLAVNYDMIGWRVGRNRVLIGDQDGLDFEFGHKSKGNSTGKGRKLSKLRERVVLFDAILQSIDSIKELQGAARDSGFIAELDGKRAYFQALKYDYPLCIIPLPNL
jgi:signal recognition particle subunit SRP68